MVGTREMCDWVTDDVRKSGRYMNHSSQMGTGNSWEFPEVPKGSWELWARASSPISSTQCSLNPKILKQPQLLYVDTEASVGYSAKKVGFLSWLCYQAAQWCFWLINPLHLAFLVYKRRSLDWSFLSPLPAPVSYDLYKIVVLRLQFPNRNTFWD